MEVFWTMGVTLDSLEKMAILRCLRICGNNKTAAADALGISVRTIDNKLAKYKEDEELERLQNEQRAKLAKEKLASHRGVTNFAPGFGLQPTVSDTEEFPLPVSEPEKVQSVLPFQVTDLGPKKPRGAVQRANE